MGRIVLVCLYLALLASCTSAPINSFGASNDDSRQITVGDRCSIVLLTENAQNECFTVKADFAGKTPQTTVFAISANGPDAWTTNVRIELLDASGPLCSLSFNKNGVAECGRFTMSDSDTIRAIVTATPNKPTGVSLTLETSSE